MKSFLFNSGKHKPLPSFALLVMRASFGLMMISHGWSKLVHFGSRSGSFTDPLHIGNSLSMGLVVFAEFFCAILVVIGLMTRLATVPIIIVMIIASFVIHGSDPFSTRELSLLYLTGFTAILILGSGSYSLDHAISGK